jgi:hypothetical protein
MIKWQILALFDIDIGSFFTSTTSHLATDDTDSASISPPAAAEGVLAHLFSLLPGRGRGGKKKENVRKPPRFRSLPPRHSDQVLELAAAGSAGSAGGGGSAGGSGGGDGGGGGSDGGSRARSGSVASANSQNSRGKQDGVHDEQLNTSFYAGWLAG